ncbi:RNaseH domain-containing protein [Limnobacter sp.]|uniref:RNaseH domain-containing protein n=1 Tax=Limnobacter sp. TaxID=2003368 RepID=UPI0039189EB7
MSTVIPEGKKWRKTSKRTNTSVAFAASLKDEWLNDFQSFFEIRAKGKLADFFVKASEVLRSLKLYNLPTGSLGFLLAQNGLSVFSITVQQKANQPGLQAMLIHEGQEGIQPSIDFAEALIAWNNNCLDPWTQKHGIAYLSEELASVLEQPVEEILDQGVVNLSLLKESGALNYGLAAFMLAKELEGQTVFEDLPPVRIIYPCRDDTDSNSFSGNKVTLVTPPTRSGNESFSMELDLQIDTVPGSSRYYLHTAVRKRNWSSKVPDQWNSPRTTSSYVFTEDGGVYKTEWTKSTKGQEENGSWEPGWSYKVLHFEGGDRVPLSFDDVVSNHVAFDSFDPESGSNAQWWVGYPESSQFKKDLSKRSIFEMDEFSCFDAVRLLLAKFLDKKPVRVHTLTPLSNRKADEKKFHKTISLPDFQANDEAELLLMELAEEIDDADEFDLSDLSKDTKEGIEKFRLANQKIFQATYGHEKPILWVVSNKEIEVRMIKIICGFLFGNALQVKTARVPEKTHGLRKNLPGESEKANERFKLRVQAWSSLMQEIAEKSVGMIPHILICESKKFPNDKGTNSFEDPINYYAGIYSSVKIGANVHYLLPVEPHNSKKRIVVTKVTGQFVHRCQAALLDMMFAHYGKQVGIRSYIREMFPEGTAPEYLYGYQKISLQENYKKGVAGRDYLVLSRIDSTKETTEFKFAYANGQDRNSLLELTEWMLMSDALIWMGRNSVQHSRRTLRDSRTDKFASQETQRILKEFLIEIQTKNDSNSILIVDFKSLAGLLKVFSNDAITKGETKIDGIPLSDFSRIAILRYKDDKILTIREESRTEFTSVILNEDGKSIKGMGSESFFDQYFTTGKKIFELADTESSGIENFIITMGYKKTSQGKRGLSCYRQLPRMVSKKLDPESDEPQEVSVIEYSSPKKDGTIPAPIEVTVLQRPEDWGKELLPSLIVKLRTDYAHYDDWTKKPSPLFYERKIRDYIIQHDLEDEEEVESLGETDAEDTSPIEDLSPVEQELTARIIDDGIVELEPDASPAQKGTDFEVHDALEELSAEEDGAEGAGDEVKEKNREALADSEFWSSKLEGLKSTAEFIDLIEEILRSDDAEALSSYMSRKMYFSTHAENGWRILKAITRIKNPIRTEVLLPPFARNIDLYQVKPKILKRNFGRAWKHLTISAQIFSRQSKPSDPQRWIKETTEILAGTEILNYMSPYFEGMYMVPFINAIDAYNQDLEPNDRKLGAYGMEPEAAKSLVKWCFEKGHDEHLAWIILQLGHRGTHDTRKAMFNAMKGEWGPKTRQAMAWVVTTINLRNAVEEVLERNTQGNSIYSNATQMHELFPSGYQQRGSQQSGSEAPQEGVSRDLSAISRRAAQDTETNTTEEEFMAKQIETLVSELKPGAPQFAREKEKVSSLMVKLEGILNVQKQSLEALEVAHKEVLERQERIKEQEGELSKARKEAQQNQQEILLSVNEAAAECGETVYKCTEISEYAENSQIEKTNEYFEKIYNASLLFTNAKTGLGSTQSQAPSVGAPAFKQKAHKELEAKQISEVIELATLVVNLALESELYEVVTDGPAYDPRDTKNEGDQKVEPHYPTQEEASRPSEVVAKVYKTKAEGDHPESEIDGIEPAASPVDRSCVEEINVPQVVDMGENLDETEKPGEQVASNIDSESTNETNPQNEDEGLESDELDHETEDTSSLPFAQDALREHIPTLTQMVAKRLYGFADIQVQALSEYVKPFFGDGNLHLGLIKTVCQSLEAVECKHNLRIKVGVDLQNTIHETNLAPDEFVQVQPLAIGAMAAFLPSFMFDFQQQGNIGLLNIIQNRLQGIPSVVKVFEQIAEINNRGIAITKDVLFRSRVGEEKAIKEELEANIREAKNWMESSRMNSNIHHKGAKAVNFQLFGAGSQIHALMQMIVKNEHIDKIISAYDAFSKKLTARNLESTVEEARKACGERDKITGNLKAKILENLSNTADFIEAYIERVQTISKGGKTNQQAERLFMKLSEYLLKAKHDIGEVVCFSPLDEFYKQCGEQMLSAILNLFEKNEPIRCIDPEAQKLLVMVPFDKDMNPAIYPIDEKTPGVILPESVLQATTEALGNSEDFFDENEENLNDFLFAAMDEHKARKRFFPAFKIYQKIGAQSTEKTDQFLKEYKKERDELGQSLNREKQRVVRAMALSALSNDIGNQMRSLIADMQEANRSNNLDTRYGIGHPDEPIDLYPDFPQAKSFLRSWVISPLDQVLIQAQEDLIRKIEILESPDSPYNQMEVAKIRNMVDLSTNGASNNSLAAFRSASDAITILEDKGELPELGREERNYAKEYDAFCDQWISDFQGNMDPIEELKKALSGNSSKQHEMLEQLSKEERHEAASFIESWVKTFKELATVKSEPQNFFDVIGAIGLGDGKEILFDNSSNSARVSFQMNDDAFLITSNRDEDLFVPPELGSRANSIGGFLISGVKANANSIQKQIASGISQPRIIFFRGRLKMEERAQASASKPVILIDDNMIAYLALRPKERLRSLIRIGVMTFETNPFRDYGTKPVPTEMFFGRKEILQALTNNTGFILLYGGRRLGKSSLLSESERTINSDEFKSSKALIVNMDMTGGSNYPDGTWAVVYRALQSEGLVDPMQSKMTADDYQAGIRNSLKKNLGSIKSLSLMLDECDDLMDSELKNPGREASFVRQLIKLTEDLDREGINVNVVFAGLHNVTRMSSEVNSPLGKAKEIGLGTFLDGNDLSEGVALVRQPFKALGYEFEDENVPLQILSICNFYPAFVQIYCEELLNRVKRSRQSKAPPFMITYKDLDAVESSQELVVGLQNKFKRNLDLDERYRAIALVLAADYYKKVRQSGVNRGMSDSDIRKECKSFAPRHFENITDDLFRVLLNEMIKLNVLEKRESVYGLRNPDVAFMIGTKDEVDTKLLEINDKTPNYTRSSAHKRLYLKTPKNEFTMLPFSQGWGVNLSEHLTSNSTYREVIVLCGGKNSGLPEFADLINQISNHNRAGEYRIGENLARIATMTGSGTGGLSKFKRADIKTMGLGKEPIFLFLKPGQWDNDQINKIISSAREASMRNVQIILLATIEKTVQLLTDLAETDPEKKVLKSKMNENLSCTGNLRVESFPVWSEDAIYFALEENVDVAGDSELIKEIFSASSGQHGLIQRCIHGVKDEETLAKRLKEVRMSMPASLDQLRSFVGVPEIISDDRFINLLKLAYELDIYEVAITGEDLLEVMAENPRTTHEDVALLKAMGLIFEGNNGRWRMQSVISDLVGSFVEAKIEKAA